jgi:uncharacterized protein YjbJ (UPF0337 family)
VCGPTLDLSDRPASNLHSWEAAPEATSPRAVRNASGKKREIKMGEIIDKAKGRIKQAEGALAGDKKLQSEGRVDEASGKVKGAVEDVKHAIKDAVKK